jgi:hypothetical protein
MKFLHASVCMRARNIKISILLSELRGRIEWKKVEIKNLLEPK